MNSVSEEIMRLRGEIPYSIDKQNTNRYRLLVNEPDGSKTAYYFSCPIYNKATRKMVNMKFNKTSNAITSYGSNASISYSDTIKLACDEGSCNISLPYKPVWVSERLLRCGGGEIFCTANGFICKTPCVDNLTYRIKLDIPSFISHVKVNSKYMSFMISDFRPFLTVSAIGVTDYCTNVCAPLALTYQRLSNNMCEIIFSSTSAMGKWILFEVNLYENKLLQDTTVESNNPTLNNAFGTVGFIGRTEKFGEQWLYSKIDYSHISEMYEHRLKRVFFHMPKMNSGNIKLRAIQLNSRFCSFGSSWNNKVSAFAPKYSDSASGAGYLSFDITELLTDKHQRLEHTNGIIIRSPENNGKFAVIGTGDSCFSPQILEINFK